ncbi:pyrroline-5-carboxylate reductase [Corynebacterium otitidis ATCC 51513]|uniref:Pyrroline-5-carboxylate reductase n=2 Tax=Corynebacterium otitidis TaxID=29321 RepID=I7L9V3_9CORY|nr:pyrroline-5-carboxylate reductase [Corynebacterium otitidis ATCC 51513]CCI84097.1 pyrroline-5-carboxylate reductase [Corynebacterium otitidis ATCC 51513]
MGAMTSIAVLGGGKIGESLISGLVKSSEVNAGDIKVSNRRQERADELSEAYGVTTTLDNAEAVAGADVVFVAVKPPKVAGVLEEVAGALKEAGNPVVVSLAAGIGLDALQEPVAEGTPVVRVMPNTPMMVGRGVCAVSRADNVSDEQLTLVEDLLSTVGRVVAVDEANMDAVTALSGSSPAYIYLVAESLIDAGVQLGVPRAQAVELVTGAVAGAGDMLTGSGDGPAQLRINVSSPGGTTVHALRELEESGIRGAFFRAAEACAERSAELGKPAGKDD